tara:strand:- start:1026 stop:1868 length:843 start_codon:yes stop_codon:yes gene_type:complete
MNQSPILFTRKLPVFFHIPKCAGTYVYSIFCRISALLAGVGNIKYIIVKQNDFILYRLICTTNKPLDKKYKKQDRWTYFVDYDDLDINDLNLVFVEVCARSFSDYKNYIFKNLPGDVVPYEFIFLRDPYSLAISLFNYLTSDKSNHEPTGASINSNKFEDYLNSSRLQGSWLIHNLLNIPDPEPITLDDFNKTCDILDSMLVADMSDVDYTILKVIEDCFNIVDKEIINKIPDIRKVRNKTTNKLNVQFSDLEEKTKAHFMSHTKWDNRLYNKYKNANIT